MQNQTYSAKFELNISNEMLSEALIFVCGFFKWKTSHINELFTMCLSWQLNITGKNLCNENI